MLKELRGSDVIIECLLEQGVDTVFGYPGGAVLNIYDSLYKYSDKIHHVITAHEQAACHAADGYSRTTGRTGVVIATSGPGATNLVTGIATAYMDSIPMVAITGNVTRDLLGLDSFQEVDICGITMPITKHNYIVKDPAELADIIREAFYIANEGRKGPVLIDIPKDITGALMVYEKKEPKKVVNHNPEGINEEIAAAAELIKNAEKPFIYAGGGVVSADATEEMAEFVRKVDAPVSLSLMGQCALDNTKDCYIGMLGMHGTKTAAMTLSECDLMIVLGSRFSDRVLCNAKTFAKDKKIIHIDIDPAEIGKNIDVYSHVTGDVKYILAKLCELLPDMKHEAWMNTVMDWKKQYALRMVPIESEDEVLPQDVIEELARRMAAAGIEAFFETNVATFALEPAGVEQSSLIGTSVVHSTEEMRVDGSLRVGKVCLSVPSLARVANDDGFIDREFELCNTGGQNRELSPKGIDKGVGVARALEYLGRTGNARTFGFGDSGNDLGMLAAVETAVAMGNAMPEVKALADYVTDDVAHDGTVTAMQHFGLI